MLVELVERLGHSFEWWLDQPLAFLRYCYCHLQEIDRRRGWIADARQLEMGWHTARAFHDPDALRTEHQQLLARAAGAEAETIALERGQAMLAEFERGQTLDGLTYRE